MLLIPDIGLAATIIPSAIHSFAYSKTTDPGSPVCPADIAYLESSDANKNFCSSFIGYVPPTTTVSVVSTVSTVTATTSTTTVISTPDPSYVTVSVTSISTTTSVVPVTTVVTITTTLIPPPAPVKRVVPSLMTPSSIATWPASKISSACLQVATDTVTSTVIATTTTIYVSTSVVVSTVTSVAPVPVVTSSAVKADYHTVSGKYLAPGSVSQSSRNYVPATLDNISNALIFTQYGSGVMSIFGGTYSGNILDLVAPISYPAPLTFVYGLGASFRFSCQFVASSLTCQFPPA
jgi:hypothetical protein